MKINALSLKLAAALSLAIALVACGDDTASQKAAGNAAGSTPAPAPKIAAMVNPSGLGPVQVTTEAANAFKRNDLRTMVKLMMPDADYAKAQTEWDTKRKTAPTAKERADFTESLNKLLAPGAIDKLVAEAEPKLTEMKPQLAMIPMFAGMAQQGIQADETKSAAEKAQLTAMLNAAQGWAVKTDFTDANRLRKALNEIANGVRATKITSLDQMQALSFDQVLDKAGVMVGGMKSAMRAYDLNLDDIVASYKAEQVSVTGNNAKIKTTVTMFGQQIVGETDMVKVGDRWFSKGSVDAIKQAAEKVTGSKLDQPAGGG
jgi:hypothetical protein